MYYVYVRGGGSMRVDRPGDGWSETSCRFIERGRGVSGSTVSSSDEPSMTDWSERHTHNIQKPVISECCIQERSGSSRSSAWSIDRSFNVIYSSGAGAYTWWNRRRNGDGCMDEWIARCFHHCSSHLSLSLSYIPERERELLDAGAFDHFMILSQHGNHAPNHQSLLCVCGSSRTPAESFFIDISSSLPFLHFFWCLVATRKKRHEMERFWQTCRIRDDKNIYSRARNKKREREKLRHRREATEAGWKEGENINYAGHVAMGWSARAKASNRGRRSETFHPIRTGPPKRRDGGGRESMPISFSISFASHTTAPKLVDLSNRRTCLHSSIAQKTIEDFFFLLLLPPIFLKSPKLQKRRNAKKEIKRR